jgi:uncharacterized protein YbjQ (UPF0145 family)
VLPSRAISVTTTAAVPGREIAAVIGDVVGVVVRPRELSPELRVGNPLDGYATMLTRSRQDAVTKMIDMAVAAGADAVIGFGYDSSEITQSLSEIAAYGTAVKLAPEPGLTAEPAAAAEPSSAVDPSSAATPASAPRRPAEQEDPVRDEASSATTLSRPAAAPSGEQAGQSGDSSASADRSWPPSSWPSQN